MAKFYSSDLPEYQVEPESFEFVQMEGEIADEKFQDKPIGFFKDAMLRFCRSKVSIIAFIGIVIVLLFAVFAPALSRWDYNDQDLNRINLPPKVPVLENYGILDGTRWLTNRRVDSLEDTSRYPEGSILKVINHRTVQGVEMCDIKVDYYKYSGVEDGTYFWMGTDYLGRDLWVRMWRGARVSLLIAFISVICNVCIGIVYGSIAGYYGGKVDMIMMRIVDIISTIPLTLYVILIMQVLGAGIQSIIVALGSVYWVDMARVVRGQILSLKQQEFVLAAKTIGSSATTILFDHLIPNALGSILVTITMLIPSAIFMEAFLGYLGIGLQPPLASLGTMCNDASANLRTSPHELLIPALMICVIMFAFNFVGDGLRDALDPKLKK